MAARPRDAKGTNHETIVHDRGGSRRDDIPQRDGAGLPGQTHHCRRVVLGLGGPHPSRTGKLQFGYIADESPWGRHTARRGRCKK